jgi:adenylate cyclase
MDRFNISQMLNEVIRRKVARVAIGYAVVMWLLLQIAEVTFEPLHLPEWALTLLLVTAIAGFAVALVLAWAFEVTPEGLKRDLRGQPTIGVDNAAPTVNENVHRSVAVLPFADMSPARDQRYFCEGIAEEILSLLSTVKYLRVPSRTSSFRFSTGEHDIREIGDALNVETVLEGSVRKSADRFRITAQLIDARNGYHLWANVYERKLSGIFEVQRELSEDIVRQLCESLNSKEIVFPEPTSAADIHAYDYYLQGRYFLNRHSEQSVKFAIQMFTKAVEIDSGMSLAWAGLCEAHTYLYINCPSSNEHRKFAWDAAEKAISLSPDSAPCRTALGMALMIDRRYADADVEFSSALSMKPQQFWASYYYARSCLLQGNLEQAAELFEHAHQNRPEDYQAPLLLVSIYKQLGRNDEAYKAARRGTRAAERHLELHPDDARALYLGCLGFLALEKPEVGRSWAERAIALNPCDCLTRYNVACFYAQAGDIDLAFANLSKVCIKRKEFADWIATVPDLGALRGDPRFESLV